MGGGGGGGGKNEICGAMQIVGDHEIIPQVWWPYLVGGLLGGLGACFTVCCGAGFGPYYARKEITPLMNRLWNSQNKLLIKLKAADGGGDSGLPFKKARLEITVPMEEDMVYEDEQAISVGTRNS